MLANERSEQWKELLNSTDMTLNSRKAWKTIKKLNSEKSNRARVAVITPNQVANHLLQNGTTPNKEEGHQKRLKTKMYQAIAECNDQFEEFSLKTENRSHLYENCKGMRLDGIRIEMIQHIGLASKCWIQNLFNKCASTNKIPKGWNKN